MKRPFFVAAGSASLALGIVGIFVPVLPTTPPPAPPEDETALEAKRLFDSARELFRAMQYQEAQAEVERAIKLLPSDAALHEFRLAEPLLAGVAFTGDGRYLAVGRTSGAVTVYRLGPRRH